MNIAIAMGIRDDVEMIQASIEYHLALGIYKIFIIDFNSKDGTREILESYQSNPQVHLSFINEDIIGNRHLQQALRLQVYHHPEIDYMVHLDPDEFLILKKDYSLNRIFQEAPSGCYHITRRNMVPIPALQKSFPPKILSHLHRLLSFEKASLSQEQESDPLYSLLKWVQKPPLPKVMHKLVPLQLNMGFHGIYSPEIPTSIIPKNIAIAHIPLSTFSRFLRKLQNVHQCLVESPELYPGSTAYHWKQWNKVYLEEKAEDLYQKSFLSSLEIQQLIRSSNILPFKKLLSQPEKKITLRPLSEEHSYPLYPPQKTENHP